MYQLIFCMEDQANTYLVDLEEGTVVQSDHLPRGVVDEQPDRFTSIPDWQPADGFRIMEKFVSTLRNPVFSARLRESLALGKGVFRRFKNVLKEEPAIERLWYYFKEKEMKQEVYRWYEELSEAVRMEQQGEEPEEETEELILSDFIVTDDAAKFPQKLREISEELLEAEFSQLEPPVGELFIEEYRDIWREIDESWIRVFLESPAGDLAGCIAAEAVSPAVYEVKLVYVYPRFRGLGVFSLLTEELCGRAYKAGAIHLLMRISGKAALLAGPLEKRSFSAVEQRFALNLSAWSREKKRGS